MLKKEIRKKYNQLRGELSESEIARYTDLVLIQFQQLDLPFLNCVHTYLSSDKHGEIDTSLIVRYLQFRNLSVTVAAPRLTEAGDQFISVGIDEDTAFTQNDFGIDEPAEGNIIPAETIDLVLVPLLAFDWRGFRVGYGKGYYDKFLASCRPDVIKVGLSFFGPEEPFEDIDGFDIPLNFCITPHRIFRF